MAIKEEIVTYGMAFLTLPAGNYTRQDVEAMLQYFDIMDRQLKEAMEEVPHDEYPK